MNQLRKHYGANRQRLARFRFRANQRAAKERLRKERADTEPSYPAGLVAPVIRAKPSGFRVVITCLDDGSRVQFTTFRDPWGALTVSATNAARRVATILSEYKPCNQL